MTHKIRRVRVEECAYYVNKLRQNVGLVTWIWRQIVTSQTVHTKYKWPLHATEWNPPMKIFCVRHCPGIRPRSPTAVALWISKRADVASAPYFHWLRPSSWFCFSLHIKLLRVHCTNVELYGYTYVVPSYSTCLPGGTCVFSPFAKFRVNCQQCCLLRCFCLLVVNQVASLMCSLIQCQGLSGSGTRRRFDPCFILCVNTQ